jgi:CubicO group peptidase (beta-lactamase class C family)
VRDLVAHLPAAVPDATGVALGILQSGRELILASGTTGGPRPRPVTGRTRFEIGSLTKAFVGLLLAEMTDRGEVDPADPVRRHLPPGTAPQLGREVTLERLATHTSGLPRLPPGLLRRAVRRWRTNPYLDFGQDELAGALRRTRAKPPGRYRYSSFGVALLGHVLACAAGLPFEDLLTERVLRPLGLDDTGFATFPQVTGHLRGRSLPPWEIPGLPAAGALRSSALDLLHYLAAHLTPPATTLGAAVLDVTHPRASNGDREVCLVWNLRRRPAGELLFHSGGTRGCTSFAAFSPTTGTAFVALANAGPTVGSTFVRRAYEAAWALVERAADTQPVDHERHVPRPVSPVPDHGSEPRPEPVRAGDAPRPEST